MRVFLTGATGFIGAPVLARLLGGEHAVLVLVRPGSEPRRIGPWLSRVERVVGSLDDVDALVPALRRFEPDTFVHLAWTGVAGRDRNDARQIHNVEATARLALAASTLGVRSFVATGSQAEYGPVPRAIDEECPTCPTTLYGTAKLSALWMARRIVEDAGLRFAWLRVFSTYGPGDRPDWMIPSLILDLCARRRPALTRGEQRWDYLYVDDAADAIVRVAETGASGVFNLGSGEPTLLRAVIERIRDLVDPSLPLGFGDVAYRPDQVMHLEANIERLRVATGWKPTTSLSEGLRRTVEWYRDDGANRAGREP